MFRSVPTTFFYLLLSCSIPSFIFSFSLTKFYLWFIMDSKRDWNLLFVCIVINLLFEEGVNHFFYDLCNFLDYVNCTQYCWDTKHNILVCLDAWQYKKLATNQCFYDLYFYKSKKIYYKSEYHLTYYKICVIIYISSFIRRFLWRWITILKI